MNTLAQNKEIIGRVLAWVFVTIIWGLVILRTLTVLSDTELSAQWQFASIIPGLLVASYLTAIFAAWLKR